MKPSDTESICLISFEIARIRLGGGPDTRPGFWKAYREQLEVNRKTNYQNDRVKICERQLASIRFKSNERIYFRNGRLTREKDCLFPSQEELPRKHPS